MKFPNEIKSDKILKKYTEFLNHIYGKLLLRSPDEAGLNHYISLLANDSMTMEDVKKEILESDESKLVLAREKYTKPLEELYNKLLLRSPDEAGLNHYISLLANDSMTMEDVKKEILESDEGKSIQSFSHYSSQYWNDLEGVQRYKNRLATGSESNDWIDDILSRFKVRLPFDNVLIVGCGNGWLERRLSDSGIGLHFDAFDISESYLSEARKEKGNRSIQYFVADFNNMENIEDGKYDAVFNFAVLHHAENIEFVMKKLARVLKPEGLMFNEEYVGPSRNQYTNEHVEIMQSIMTQLPERFWSKYPLRPNLADFRVEPSEAIHSDLIRPIFEKYFDIVYDRDLNGGIAYQILWNNINAFRDQNDSKSRESLKILLDEDLKLSQNKKVPVLFWYGVGAPKMKNTQM